MQDKLILYVDNNFYSKLELWEELGDSFTIHTLTNGLEAYNWLLEGNDPDVIIAEVSLPGYNGLNLLSNVKSKNRTKDIPFILVCDKNFNKNIKEARRLGANDIYMRPLAYDRLKTRINTLIQLKTLRTKQNQKKPIRPSFSFYSLAESMLALFCLALLSPILILTAIALVIDSRGPVFTMAPMVGKGYKIFDGFRFRAVRWQKDWEQGLNIQSQINLFQNNECEDCLRAGEFCSPLHYIGNKSICENLYKKRRASIVDSEEDLGEAELTKLGRLLRKTGIERLPHLINVFKGEMSFVGIEALSPTAAEKYTSDEKTSRFMIPAGMIISKNYHRQKLFSDQNLSMNG